MTSVISLVTATILLAAVPAWAQPPAPGRGYVSLNAAAQPASADLSDRFEFEANVETATADVRYPAKAGLVFDGGAGLRFWKRLGAGVAVSHSSASGTAAIDASIPHPFVFGQPRQVSGEQGAIRRAETAAHVQILYFVPAKNHLRFVLSAGPSLMNLELDVVTEVQYAETFPFDTATFTRATTRRAKGSAVGFHAGADVTWMFGRTIGLGGLVRFTRAQVDIDIAEGRRLSIDTGGVQAGGGLRILF
jgi:hypothetical protein